MLHLVSVGRNYNPETIAVMTAAFDRTCAALSAPNRSNKFVRRRLALEILRNIDQGERDPARLADVALRELTAMERTATG